MSYNLHLVNNNLNNKCKNLLLLQYNNLNNPNNLNNFNNFNNFSKDKNNFNQILPKRGRNGRRRLIKIITSLGGDLECA